MSDYRNQQDIENAQSYSLDSTLNQVNNLAKLLASQNQLKAQQQFDINKINYAEQLKEQADEAKRKAQVNMLGKLMGVAPGASEDEIYDAARKTGASVKIGDISTGTDPAVKVETQKEKDAERLKQNQARAIQHVQDTYNKRIAKFQSIADHIHEGLAAVNDPNQIGSTGMAKSILINAITGMNRFNEDEGRAMVPTSISQKFTTLMNGLGEGNNPLSPQQRQAINSALVEGLNTLKKSHEMVRSSALSDYQSNPYYDEARGNTLKQNLGGAFSKSLDDELEHWKGYGQSKPPMAAPHPTSMIDRLKGFLGSGSSPQPSQTPSTPAPQTQGFDPDAYLNK